jgi:glycosyltransferase involved in cell wall biosynthesis
LNKSVLVVNGQHHKINSAGGAARYCRQLHKRLIDLEREEDLNHVDVYLENFQHVDCLNVSAVPLPKRVSNLIKHAVCQCCPPIIFEPAQKIYQYTKKTGNSIPDNNKTVPPWVFACSKISSKTLLHELTNYRVIGEIGRLSLSSNFMLAVTFLDIQDFYYPEYFQYDILRTRRLLYSFFKDRADIFFAISEFTKETMVDKLGICPEKIRVTHLAADDFLVLQPSDNIVDWATSYGRYWIYPAKAWKHKNHNFLLKALGKRCKELRRASIKMILTGGFNQDDNRGMETLIERNFLNDIVEILGFVSDEQLQVLIQSAEYLIFPSLFEGFGMPLLEAMTLGCPVISSNAASLPEVGGDAAIYFNPDCEDELIALIDLMISGAIDRDSMIQKGFANCKRFSWNKTYRNTLNVYKELLF